MSPCAAVCWAGALSDVLVAAVVMLLVGRHMAATGALVGAHGAPLRKLALGLGAGCGAAGYFVIHRLHGDAQRSALLSLHFPPPTRLLTLHCRACIPALLYCLDVVQHSWQQATCAAATNPK